MELGGKDLCRTSSGETSPYRSRDPPRVFSSRLPLTRQWSLQRGEARSKTNQKLLSELRQVPMWQQQGNGKGSADPTEIPKLRHLSKYETMERALEYPGKSNELVVRSLGCSTKSFTSY